MFGSIKKVFFTAVTCFKFNVLSVNSLECVLMNNQECKVREIVINVNTDNHVFYPFNVKVNNIVIISMIHMLDYMFQILLKKLI